MMDREKVIGLLQETAEYFRECRSNASFASKAENHFWELQNAANEAAELLKEQGAREQCLKTKCVICPHCDHCDVDENGQLKEHEIRELTIEEWQKWKSNPKRNPICELWENDTSPMWILNPNDVHEPALLMGKLKLFTGKPTFEQCKGVKWK